RRNMLEEEARKAVEQAEREAAERADAEARAMADATRRAQEQATRAALEEAQKRNQMEHERKAQEKEERKQREEEARKRAEFARLEAERVQREQALAKQRAEQEERDRQKAARKALLDARRRSGWKRFQPHVLGVLVVFALIAGGLHLLPMSFYTPSIERIASQRLGEPVAIGELHVALFPSPEIKLDDVKIGKQLDIRVGTIRMSPEIGSLFEDRVRIKRLEALDATASAEALPRIVGWFQRPEGQGVVEFRRISLKNGKIALQGVDVPSVSGDFLLGIDGSFKGGDIRFTDSTLKATLTPNESDLEVALSGRAWKPTFGPGILVNEVIGKGVVSGSTLKLTGVDGTMYGGSFTATADIDWSSGWSVKGEFTTERVDLHGLMEAFTRSATSTGDLQSQGKFEMTAPKFAGLFDAPKVQVAFALHKGNLDGVDLVRALQTPRSEGVRGGKTKYDTLSGTLYVAGNRYQYRDLRMQAGVLFGAGSFDIDAAQNVGGRTLVELRSPSNQFRGNFAIGGNLNAIVLKP
ncbi:MAG: hypothetical protein JNL33_01385, partial [Betaproteobacteria bacterium]|nr:hypothetical protein [Betaproteobacteria bacterium]